MTHPNPQLHRLLAICPMGTPPLGTLLHRHERTVRRWINGQYLLDAEMAAWIAHLCDWIDSHPAPHTPE